MLSTDAANVVGEGRSELRVELGRSAGCWSRATVHVLRTSETGFHQGRALLGRFLDEWTEILGMQSVEGREGVFAISLQNQGWSEAARLMLVVKRE